MAACERACGVIQIGENARRRILNIQHVAHTDVLRQDNTEYRAPGSRAGLPDRKHHPRQPFAEDQKIISNRVNFAHDRFVQTAYVFEY